MVLPWQELIEYWLCCHSWPDIARRSVTAMAIMTIALIALAVVAIVATLHEVLFDGYRRARTAPIHRDQPAHHWH
jgi:hypothetical protein